MSPAVLRQERESAPVLPLNTIVHGDCIEVMRRMPSASIDLVLTDPPYLVRYRSRNGESIANDDRDDWLEPAFAEMYRLLKSGSFCLSFYGWNAADKFILAWRKARFRIVGHVVFQKKYASSKRFFEHRHEQAYLLAKGHARLPASPLADVRLTDQHCKMSGRWGFTAYDLRLAALDRLKASSKRSLKSRHSDRKPSWIIS